MRAAVAALLLLGCANGGLPPVLRDTGPLDLDAGPRDAAREDAPIVECIIGALCAAPGECCLELQCVGGACCKPEGAACAGEGECCAPLECAAGTCEMPVTCGAEGQPCCGAPSECATGLECIAGQCAPSCGGDGEACCAGDACEAGLACDAGVCGVPPTDPCALTTCGTCTDAAGCGWCRDVGRCMAGTTAGPTTGACTGWAWTSDGCPETCAAATDCGACTSLSTCGWCATTGSCVISETGVPEMGACADFRYLFEECACSPVQGGCSVDTQCCAGLSCRRGVTFPVRCCVEAGDACTTGGDCCGQMDCVLGLCECRTAGRGCLDNRDCCSGTCSGGFCA